MVLLCCKRQISTFNLFYPPPRFRLLPGGRLLFLGASRVHGCVGLWDYVVRASLKIVRLASSKDQNVPRWLCCSSSLYFWPLQVKVKDAKCWYRFSVSVPPQIVGLVCFTSSNDQQCSSAVCLSLRYISDVKRSKVEFKNTKMPTYFWVVTHRRWSDLLWGKIVMCNSGGMLACCVSIVLQILLFKFCTWR